MAKEKIIPFRTAYSPYKRVGFETTGESLTHPEFAEDLKIQNLLKKYDVNNLLDSSRKAEIYGDFTQINDLAGAMDQIQAAQDNFAELPAEIREQFKNDPRQFYQFVINPDNERELQDMGLLRSLPYSSPIEDEYPDQPSVEPTNSSEEG